MISRFALALTLLSAALSLPVLAQNSVGRISGTLTDLSGGVLPDADVTVTNAETQTSRIVKTDANGFFVVTNLPAGTYTVRVEKIGFKRAEKTGIALVADGRVTANLTLSVGDNAQTIEVVSAAAEVVNSVSGEIARVIDSEQVQNLALNGRNFLQLATLIPGSVITDADQLNLTTSLSATTQNINGNRGNSTNQMVDGSFNLVAGSNGSLINNVGIDFIREVKIQTSNFSSEYGRNSGAAVNVLTRGGTNGFHGSALEFFRNDVLDARNYFSPTKPRLRFNDFGYAFGGPIKRNKLFFFFGEEWKKIRRDTQPSRKSLPSTAQLNGNFSNLSNQLVFPGATNPIPGNIIPPTSITADGMAIANVYRRMQSLAVTFADTPTANNTVYQLNNPFNFREDIFRVDYPINDKHSVWARYLQDDNNLIEPYGTFSSTLLPTVPTNRLRPGKSSALGWTYVISPTLVFESRGSASWVSQHIPPVGDNWKRSTYGFQFPELYNGGLWAGGIPDVSITSFTGFQGPSFALFSPTTDIQTTQTISWIKGGHVLKSGFTFIRDRVDQNGRPNYTGNIAFNASGNPNSTGNALADALLGNFRTYSEGSGDPVGFFRFSQYEWFVQDNWKASKRLSLEFGFRGQYGTPIYTQANNMVNFDPALYNPAQAVTVLPNGTLVPGSGNRYNGLIREGNGIPNSELGRVPNATSPDIPLVPTGAPRGLWHGQTRWAPRFGFSYLINDKTVMRGGIGLFFDRPEGNTIFSAVNNPPYLSLSQFENGNLTRPGGGSVAALAPFDTITVVDPNLKIPYSEQYSFGFQRELPFSILTELSYVGNLGRHLLREPDINAVPFGLNTSNAALPSAQRASANFLRLFKGYSQIRQYRSDSTSNYHALQFYASRRAGRVTGTFAYTFSKILSDSSGNGDNPENFNDRHYNYGPASFDRSHVLVATAIVRSPTLNSWARPLRTALGGWDLSTILRYQTGAPLTPQANTSIGNRRPDLGPGDIYTPGDQRTVNNWLAKGTFLAAPADRLGNTGVGIIRGPGKQIFDFSFRKNFSMTERVRLRIQADMFNILNITNFANPSVTATDAAYGTIGSADPGRNIQLGVKLTF